MRIASCSVHMLYAGRATLCTCYTYVTMFIVGDKNVIKEQSLTIRTSSQAPECAHTSASDLVVDILVDQTGKYRRIFTPKTLYVLDWRNL